VTPAPFRAIFHCCRCRRPPCRRLDFLLGKVDRWNTLLAKADTEASAEHHPASAVHGSGSMVDDFAMPLIKRIIKLVAWRSRGPPCHRDEECARQILTVLRRRR